MLTLLLLASPAIAASTPEPYPTIAVLEAFGDACRNVENLKTVETDLIKQQWTAEIPPPDSPLGQLLAKGRSQAAEILDDPDDKMSDTRVYTKTIAGERLDIILSSIESNGTFVNGCRMYDVAETRQLETADAQRWIGRDPDKSIDRAELTIASWSPGYHAPHDSFEIFYVPAGSPVIELTTFNGIALKADFVGEIEE